MSYSLSAIGTRDDLGDAYVDAVNTAVASYGTGGPVDEMADHFAAIGDAVEGLAKVVGLPEDRLAVAVSGHANEGHAPAEGWSDEFITITISRLRPADDDDG